MYYRGYGVPKNYAEALKYFRKDGGAVWIGAMYYHGAGVEKDFGRIWTLPPSFEGRDAPCCFGVSRREADFPTARRDTETTGIAPYNISSLVSGWQRPDAPVTIQKHHLYREP
jgi:hypothetical protein